jgi:hypothetical protein
MERVGTLINKIKEQFDQQLDADKLAVTAQLLLSELQKNTSPSRIGGKVSVVLPSVTSPVFNAEPGIFQVQEPSKEGMANGWLFESNAEIPTLAHQTPNNIDTQTEIFEYHKVLNSDIESLNEKLKEERVEVATALQATPIRDLKKAIGINDRYLFVNDLFRGDENMYERSLKTINGFSIYPEAQYWIERELKVKLSWPDNSETVDLFDQLIKRRFS